MTEKKLVMSYRRGWTTWAMTGAGILFAFCLVATTAADSGSPKAPATAQVSGVPSAADVEFYRKNIEPLFLRSRGGTTPGYAACVMCHTWQTRVRFSLETPATDAGWTAEQSRRNFDVVTKLVNTANPESSRLLLKPLGGVGHTGGAYWKSREDPEYLTVLKWIRSLPADRYVAAAEPALDFEFFRSCVQKVFMTPREGHIPCSNCHGGGGLAGFAPVPQSGSEWNDQEAKRAFQTFSRVILPGNPDQSRFLLKMLHPDAGGSYTHNGPRRFQSRDDPEYRMLAAWIRGERKGSSCS